jgi:hypothetical protein
VFAATDALAGDIWDIFFTENFASSPVDNVSTSSYSSTLACCVVWCHLQFMSGAYFQCVHFICLMILQWNTCNDRTDDDMYCSSANTCLPLSTVQNLSIS